MSMFPGYERAEMLVGFRRPSHSFKPPLALIIVIMRNVVRIRLRIGSYLRGCVWGRRKGGGKQILLERGQTMPQAIYQAAILVSHI